MPQGRLHIGLIDADLLAGGTRHPNLALLKIAGFLRDNGFVLNGWDKGAERSYDLITADKDVTCTLDYDRIYMSRVFSFTAFPACYEWAKNNPEEFAKFQVGGTGSYANLSVEEGFQEKRCEDMQRLENNDDFLSKYVDHKTGANGINMRTQMPDYHLYDEFVSVMEAAGKSKSYYKDYKEYSIGFLTRGCFRKCPFCVNKLERSAQRYSQLEDFLDNERDEKGRLKRPNIYLWDDNFLASPRWEEMLLELQATNRPFQFRQGLDERLLAQSPKGKRMAELLSSSKYHGDFIFAFDNWFDRKLIVKALKIWKFYCKKETKFYLFCGFHQSANDHKLFQKDIAEIFMRIKVLMTYGCLGYIMRHEDYKKAPIPNIYVQIARWCNQPAFYKKMSFWEFCYRNQTYWEEHTLGLVNLPMKSYDEFLEDFEAGYYEDKKICLPLKTFKEFIDNNPSHRDMFLSFFTLRMREIANPELWNPNE